MSNLARHRTILTRLRERGSLAGSACTPSLLENVQVQSLIHGGVLEWRRIKAGEVLAVALPVDFARFITHHFPDAPTAPGETAPRVLGLARFRDTKSLRGVGSQIAVLRGWGTTTLLSKDNIPVDVADVTKRHGLFAFSLADGAAYRLHGIVAVIENPTLFFAFERLGLDIPLALYTQGRLSRRLLRWLTAQADAKVRVVHFGDYDPVGLADYLRLRRNLCERATLYRPVRLDHLFERFSKPDLLKGRKSRVLLDALRTAQDVALNEVVALIDTWNAGLEQEALLLPDDRLLARSPLPTHFL